MGLPRRVKFFLGSRRVVVVAILPDVGRLKRLAGGKVKLMGDNGIETSRDVLRMVARKIRLGGSSRHSIVILTFRYADANGALSVVPEPPRHLTTTAQLLVTITNDPPGAPIPIPIDIDETEPNPADEAGDEPNPDPDDVDAN